MVLHLLGLLEEVYLPLTLMRVELTQQILASRRHHHRRRLLLVLLFPRRLSALRARTCTDPLLHLSPALGLHELKHELFGQDLVDTGADPGRHSDHCRREEGLI